MVCGILGVAQTSHLCRSTSTIGSRRPPKLQGQALSFGTPRILCSNSSSDMPLTSENSAPMTGGAFDFKRATISLTDELIFSPKKVTLLRHGLSSWNDESRIQGSSNLSVLTETGIRQAERCKRALANIHFDKCFSSPISRAKYTAEIVWQGREEPLVFINSLKENLEAVDARQIYPKEYTTWREDPASFEVNGVYPLREVWGTAREAWREILLSPVSCN